MISINPKTLDERSLYKLMTGSVVPRPIALITSVNEVGVVNVAPFSYFNVVTPSPPRISVVIRHLAKGKKDTANNIESMKKFVVHIISESIVEDANLTAKPLPPNMSELELTNFTVSSHNGFVVPHLNESKIYFECSLEQVVSFEQSDMFIGRVENMYFDESIYDEGKINIKALRPIGRLAGNNYTTLGKIISLRRPE